MKLAPFLCLVATLLPATAGAQPFELRTTPRTQTVRPGERADYRISVRPGGTFRASVNLRAVFPTLGATFIPSPAVLNAPYIDSAVVGIQPYAAQVGVHPIIIEGYNGSTIVRDTVTLIVEAVPGLRGWQWFSTLNSPLPGNEITAIALEKHGAAWIGTKEGLVRYHDDAFQVYRRGDGRTGLGSNEIYALAIDSSGSGVWITTWSSIHLLRGSEWTTFPRGSAGMPQDARMFEDVAVAPDGTVYVTSFDGILRFDGTSWQVMQGSPSRGIGISIDRGGAIYVRTSGPLYRFDGDYWTALSRTDLGFEPGRLADIAFDWGNTMYAAMHNHVVRIDPTVAPPRVDTVLSQRGSHLVSGIAIGNYEPVWAVTRPDNAMLGWEDTTGLLRIEGESVTRYTLYNSGLPQAHVTTVRTNARGVIYVGTLHGGFALFDPGIAASVAAASRPRIATVAPNPATARTTIALTLARPTTLRLELVDALGRTVHTSTRELGEGPQTIGLDLEEVPSGAYVVRLSGGEVMEGHRVVVR